MQFLTRSEHRQIQAIGAYSRRPLSNLEKAIQHLTVVNAMPQKTQAEKKAKEEEVATTMRVLEDLTSVDWHRMSLAKHACYDRTALGQITEMYPFVEFESVINNGTQGFNKFQRLSQHMKPENFKGMAVWLNAFCAVLSTLPTKYGPTFIWSPHTDFNALKQWASFKKEPFAPAGGLNLSPTAHTLVCEILSGNAMFYLETLRAYNLIGDPEFWRRAQETPSDEFGFAFCAQEIECNHPYRRVDIQYLEVMDKNGNPLFYFQV